MRPFTIIALSLVASLVFVSIIPYSYADTCPPGTTLEVRGLDVVCISTKTMEKTVGFSPSQVEGYTMKYDAPYGWTVKESVTVDSVFYDLQLLGPPIGSTQSTFLVQIHEMGRQSFYELTKEVDRQAEYYINAKSFVIHTQGNYTVNDKPAYFVSVLGPDSISSNGYDVIRKMILVADPEKYYNFVYVADADNYEPYHDDFQKFVETFQVKIYDDVNSNFNQNNLNLKNYEFILDKTNYFSGDILTVKGKNPSSDKNAVIIRIMDPSGNIASVNQISPDSNGDYSSTFTLDGKLFSKNGTYKLFVNTGDHSGEMSFNFSATTSSTQKDNFVTPQKSSDKPFRIFDDNSMLLLIIVGIVIVGVIVGIVAKKNYRPKIDERPKSYSSTGSYTEKRAASPTRVEPESADGLENPNFALKQFDFAGGLERVIEVTYDKEKTVDVKLFFSSNKEEWSTFARNFVEKVKDNFVRLKIEPSRRTNSSLISGGNYEFNDDFDAGYTLRVSMKYGDGKLMHQITSILRENDFGCLPSTKFTVDAHRNHEHPTEFEAEKILATITDMIIQKLT